MGNRCRPSWTLRFPDLGDKESMIPFLRWRITLLLRDVAHKAIPCHFAKEMDARYMPPHGVSHVPQRLQEQSD